jgi:hypothetical protein
MPTDEEELVSGLSKFSWGSRRWDSNDREGVFRESFFCESAASQLVPLITALQPISKQKCKILCYHK